MKKQGAFTGAVILTASGLIVKILSAFFKIPLGAILGPEGNGVFSIAYNVYALVFVIATAGIPVAMSKTVAEADARGENTGVILKRAIFPFGILGGLMSIVLFAFSTPIAKVMGAEDARLSLMAISPAIFFVSIAAILRGYYQGLGNMIPTAISEIIEAASKFLFGILCAYLVLKLAGEIDRVAAGAVAGITLGTLFSSLFLLLKKKERRMDGGDGKGVLVQLVKTALPITMGASVVSLSNVIDSALIMNLLCRMGESESQALWLFGAYNYASTVFNLPGFLTATLGISIIPAVTGAKVMGQYKEMSRLLEFSFRLTFSIATAACGGLFLLSTPILKVLYQGVDYDAIHAGGRLLSILAFAVPTLSMSTLSASVLQALGDVKTPMYAMTIGAISKVFFNFVLISVGKIGISGAAISTVICYGITCGINLTALWKRGEINLSLTRILLLPTLSAILPTLCAKYVFSWVSAKIGNFIALFGTIGCGVLLWSVCIMLFGVVEIGDIKRLFNQKESPFFQKITKK
ncbi:MAG: polysaccharide biosynthesis protein [Clostridia bacterium]|nr:polysaccharide biosynthesis protein [Clostridia bacterium]